jgi:hypothetical protein
VSDIDTAEVDSLKALDPEWPIREADIEGLKFHPAKRRGGGMARSRLARSSSPQSSRPSASSAPVIGRLP